MLIAPMLVLSFDIVEEYQTLLRVANALYFVEALGHNVPSKRALYALSFGLLQHTLPCNKM